jgi:phosphatidylglycerol:prolipoprotein diacylglycerol transferase
MPDPIAFHIGSLAVRWYGISYGVGLGVGLFLLHQLNQRRRVFKDLDQILDFGFQIFLFGVLAGGRLGYVLFYNLPYYLEHPLKVFALWEGGMSFHGGLIASFLVAFFFCRKHRISLLDAGDLAVIPGALALTFTRLANFVNRELVGRPINNPDFQWMGIDFGDGILRYPSQLFQSASAFLLFLVLLLLFRFRPRKGVLFFSYLMLYGVFRTLTEMIRAPDPQIGFIGPFTLGQIFSLLMIVAGLTGFALIEFLCYNKITAKSKKND